MDNKEKIKKTVLLVDDDIDFQFQVKNQLEQMGLEVTTADGQKEAEKIIEEFKPDIAIFDLMMENQDSGFILSYKIKKKYPDVPVMIVTAANSVTGMVFSTETYEDKKWIKADLYLEKGIRQDQFHREIKKLLKL